ANLGRLLVDIRRPDQALAPLELAVRLRPDWPAVRGTLGNALAALGRIAEARSCLEAAAAQAADDPDILSNLGTVLQEQGAIEAALARYRRALALDPEHADAHYNFATALAAIGRPTEAEASFERALALDPDNTVAHSALIFVLDADPASTPARRSAERRAWAERFAQPLAAAIAPHANARDPERRLRIGYVAASFHRHSAAFLYGPVIRNHDKERFETVCYSASQFEDRITAELRAAAGQWREAYRLDDAELAAQIRADGIDILVDLSGHDAGNRLLTFARKPAPVQISAWGYVSGTGLAAMDYLLIDRWFIPAAARADYAERLIDLPSAFCYQPPPDAPEVAARPSDGPPVLGSLNRLAKVSDQALELWSRVLARLPEARLFLKDKTLGEAADRDALAERLRTFGIDPARAILRGGSSQRDHLAAYGEIDFALDPVPQGGGVTTLEGLWMGVPVVTQAVENLTGRASTAILSALGLTDWIADSAEAYVELAVAKCRDRAALTDLRTRLRPLLAGSVIGDAGAYTRAVEATYRDLWRRWCAGGKT
ncbi:MAG: tetratricopeptide repeat protein, partial [Alphaproteobacteria bacterium]|nr:tetratricopeptide repeat protein [Alphaproteobacteria bacterium]